ncbi:MAG: transposase [Armatimonadota bacterium]
MISWPHSPAHALGEQGAYIITAGTYQKQHLFRGSDRLSILHNNLLKFVKEYKWQLQAWAIFSNHYHFVAMSPEDSLSLSEMIKRLHSVTAVELNRIDNASGRQVWYQYWDTHLTFEKSYMARLNYVHQNPVKHGIVQIASKYPWCSARWFEEKADPAFVKAVSTFKTDKVSVYDVFYLECGSDSFHFNS